MIFNGLNNVALPIHFKHLLGDHGMGVVERHVDIGNVTIRSVEVGRVAEGTLVVWDRPGGGGHNAEIVVTIRDQAANERVLSRHVGLADY